MLYSVTPREWKIGCKKGQDEFYKNNKACNNLSTEELVRVIKYYEHFQRKQTNETNQELKKTRHPFKGKLCNSIIR